LGANGRSRGTGRRLTCAPRHNPDWIA
jgi:hypothetical protein